VTDRQTPESSEPPTTPLPPNTGRPIYAFGLVAFVKHPALRGLYMKTHLCVEVCLCPLCGAEVHEPCRRVKRTGTWDQRSWCSDTHYARRDLMFGRIRGNA
jgi:hypothetical protein